MKRRKPKAERKELVLRVRVAAEQRERLETAGRRVGTPVSTWLVSVGLEAADALTPKRPKERWSLRSSDMEGPQV